MKPGCWTDERVERLKALWLECSASEIAEQLNALDGPGVVTRNAVIGKSRRLGLPIKVEYASPGRPLKQCRPRGYERQSVARRVEQPVPVVPAVVEPVDPLRLTIVDLGVDQCRYPVDGTDKPILFCGHPVRDKDTRYCAEHHAKVYQP